MARRLTSSDWDAVLGSSSLRRISDSKPCATGRKGETEKAKKDGEEVMERAEGEWKKMRPELPERENSWVVGVRMASKKGIITLEDS